MIKRIKVLISIPFKSVEEKEIDIETTEIFSFAGTTRKMTINMIDGTKHETKDEESIMSIINCDNLYER